MSSTNPSLALRLTPRRPSRANERLSINQPFSASSADLPSSPTGKPTSPSLLSRMNLAQDTTSVMPVTTSPKRLLDRIGDFTDIDILSRSKDNSMDVESTDMSQSRMGADSDVQPTHFQLDGEGSLGKGWEPDANTCHHSSSSSEAAVDGLLHTNSDVDMKDIVTGDDESRLADPSNTVQSGANQDGPKPSPSVIEQCRKLFLSLVMQNAKRREGSASVPSEHVEQKARSLWTDDRCAEFIQRAKDVQAQLAAAHGAGNGDSFARQNETTGSVKPTKNLESHEGGSELVKRITDSDGVTSVASSRVDHEVTLDVPPPVSVVLPQKPLPTAPKAMLHKEAHPFKRKSPSSLMAERVGSRKKQRFDNESRHDATKSQHLDELPFHPISQMSFSSERAQPHAARAEERRGIPIPLDPHLLASEKSSHGRNHSDSQSPTQSPPKVLIATTQTHAHAHAQLSHHDSNPKHNSSSLSQENRTYLDSPAHPHHAVPGIWFAKIGLREPDILDVTFEIDSDTLARWRLPDELNVESKPNISLHLLCLPTKHVYSTYQKLGRDPTPEAISNALFAIKTRWPSGGTLIIEVNRTLSHGRSWLPVDLGADSLQVDVTQYVRPGANTVRFIQLADLSEFMFVLHAAGVSSSSSDMVSRELGTVPTPYKKALELKLDSYLARVSAELRSASNSSSKPGIFDLSTGTKVVIS